MEAKKCTDVSKLYVFNEYYDVIDLLVQILNI